MPLRPRWKDGLVNAFPIPVDKYLSLDKLVISDEALPTSSFPFFDLPAEIRNRIYNDVLFSKPDYRRADGTRNSRLAILLVSKRFHREASYILYATHKFLVFPIQQFTSLPTIQDLPAHYRLLVTRLKVVIGEGFHAPPKNWRVSKGLQRCLRRMNNIETLLVFISMDPSNPIWKLKKHVYQGYIDFCGDLVAGVLQVMPKLKYVQLDGNPGVRAHGLLVSRLREEAEAEDKVVIWGQEAGWQRRISGSTIEIQDVNGDNE